MSTTDAAFQLIEIGRLHESPVNPRHTPTIRWFNMKTTNASRTCSPERRPRAAGSDCRPRLTLIKPDATAWRKLIFLTWNVELHAFCGLYGFDAMIERCAQQIRIGDPSGSPRPERA
jgi:hypothetical protein